MGQPGSFSLKCRPVFYPIGFVPNRQGMLVSRPDLTKNIIHRLHLLLPLWMTGVHDMDEDIGKSHFLQGRLERFHQMRGKLFQEPDRIPQ